MDRRFAERVVPRVFGGRRPAEATPVAILLGGQPGAGKTRAARFATESVRDDVVAIVGDDFRVLHPDYKWLQKHDPVGMPTATAAVSGPMVERCIDHARAHGYSVLVEGTFRSADTSLTTANSFVDAGCDVHVVAIAVPPALSRMSAVARFYETLDHGENRWTPLKAHEVAVAALPTTVGALGESSLVAVLSVIGRAGNPMFDSAEPGPTRAHEAVTVLRSEHTRELTAPEREQLRRTYEASVHVAGTHPVALAIADDASVRDAWGLLREDQARAGFGVEPG